MITKMKTIITHVVVSGSSLELAVCLSLEYVGYFRLWVVLVESLYVSG